MGETIGVERRETAPVPLQAADITLSVPGRTLLDGADITVNAGRSAALMGPSGSGKTSLLNLLSGISLPDAGRVMVAGVDLSTLSESGRARHRLRNIGMVFQFGELLPELDVLENVSLPLRLLGESRSTAAQKVVPLLDRLGLENLVDRFPETLSGGETQRVGIARALSTEPCLVLADEPTGALDGDNARLVVELLIDCCSELNAAVLIATHDPAVARQTDRIIGFRESRLVTVEHKPGERVERQCDR